MKRKTLFALSFTALLVLYIITALRQYGYEDEIYNFFMIEKLSTLRAIVSYVNSVDFHPSGMYIINYVLLKLLGSWSLVKAVGATVSASAIWFYWYTMSRKINDRAALIMSFLAVCLNPSILLWCTSVRWYAYLMPLVCTVAMILHFADNERFRASRLWGSYFLVCLLMFYINYLSSVIIAVSFPLMLHARRKFLRTEWKLITNLGLVSLSLAVYQVYTLFAVHMKNISHSMWHLRFSISGAMNYLQGSAVIPVSVCGILFIAVNLLLTLVLIRHARYIFSDRVNNFYAVSYALIMLLFPGAIKDVRNYVILGPEQGIFQTHIYQQIRSKFMKILLLIMFATATAGGIYNVINHNDTAKVTYNMPYREVLNFTRRLDPDKEALFITNLPGMYYFAHEDHAEAILVPDGFAKNGIWAPYFPNWYDTLKTWPGKIIAVRTHQGLVSKEDYKKFTNYLNSANVKRSTA